MSQRNIPPTVETVTGSITKAIGVVTPMLITLPISRSQHKSSWIMPSKLLALYGNGRNEMSIQYNVARGVVCAAIKDQTGKVWIGKRHNDVIWLMWRHGVRFIDGQCVQGFVDDKGEFLDRKQAADLAYKCHQIAKPTIELHPWDADLYSEDLY